MVLPVESVKLLFDGDLSLTTGNEVVTENGGVSEFSPTGNGMGLVTEKGKDVTIKYSLGSSFTLSFWGKINYVDDSEGILLSAGWGNGKNRIAFIFSTALGGRVAQVNCGTDSTWRDTGIDFSDLVFMQVSYDGTTLSVYDGISAEPVLSYATTANIITEMVLGNFYANGLADYGVDGLIDNLNIYNVALNGEDAIAIRDSYTVTYKTLSESILGTDGLQSFWLLDSESDLSGNGYDLEVIGNVEFKTGDVLVDEVNSLLLSYEVDGNYVRAPILSDTFCIESWCKFPSGYANDKYMPVITYASQPTDTATGDMTNYERGFVDINPSGTLRVSNRRENGSASTIDTSIFNNAVHVVLQYEPLNNETRLYFNGIFDQSSVLGFNIFENRTGFITPAAWFNSQISMGGGMQTSHSARYNRPLTQQEINWRVYQNEPSVVTNFLPMTSVPDSINYYPEDAMLSTTAGTGLLNENGSAVYFRVGNFIDRGQTRSLINEELSLASELVFAEDGTVTLTEDLGVTVGCSESESLGFKYLNGQLAVADADSNVVLYSKGFGYNYSTIATIALPDGDTIDELPVNSYYSAGRVDFTHYMNLIYGFPVWANKETYEQANPQPVDLQYPIGKPGVVSGVAKNCIYYSNPIVDQDGNQRLYGYIASTTQLSGIPVGNKRVTIRDHHTGLLIAETVSNDLGEYRFDSLLLGKKYIITAHYGNANGLAPDYAAVAADWQTPTAYE